MALNKWLGIGRLTADPELRAIQNGVSVCSFNMAVNRAYKSGEERKADFIPVVAWRGTAEFICRNFSKGDPIQIDGRLETRSYEDNEGKKRFIMEVIADNVSFVEGAGRNNAQNEVTPETDINNFMGDFTPVEDEDMELPFG